MKTENFVKATNELNETMNKLIPLINDYFAKNDIKYKADYYPHKKYYDQIQAIIEPYKKFVYLHCSEYSTVLKFKTHYMVSEYSCQYIERHYYIGNGMPWQPLDNITVQQVEQAQIDYKKLDEKIQELESLKSKLKRFLNY